MFSSTGCSIISLFLLFYVNIVNSSFIENVSENLHQFLDIDSSRVRRDTEMESIWMEYKFNTGAGNREELVVTDISVQELANVPSTRTNWLFLEVNESAYLFNTEESSFFFYKLDLTIGLATHSANLIVEGTILTFNVISLQLEIDLVVVLCVESTSGTTLKWYRLVDGNSFEFFWSWQVQKRLKDMKFIRQEQLNKLLLLNDDKEHFGMQYSSIDVYGFNIDFSTTSFDFWFFERILGPKAFGIQLCPVYESLSLALQGENDVFLYEYRNTTGGRIFHELQTIKSNDLKNFACFESGYLQFLAISGPEAGLFYLVDGEFLFNAESEASFDVSEISWVQDVKLDTYRDESLLLIQLKNSTVIALAWQGLSFKKIELPNKILDQFDLSMVTPIPKFGFISGGKFVKFHTKLEDVQHPVQYTTERLLGLQSLLNDTLYHQEKIIDETKARYEKSYLKNSIITGFWNLSTVNVTSADIADNVIYHSVTIGASNLTREELEFDVNDFSDRLKILEQKLDEINSNLENAMDSNSRVLHFDSGVEIFGNINVTGTLNVENLSAQYINDINLTNNSESSNDRNFIEDEKSFDSIESENLTIHSVNGVPIENIRFSDFTVDYSNTDFSKINRAHIEGHLSFETINGINWEALMKNIVWKDRPMFIPGNTTIEGTLTADVSDLYVLNDLPYPEDYVLTDSEDPVIITGSKSFNTLLTPRLENVTTLNGIDFEDFVILNKDNVLKEETTFENLTIERKFQVDGEISGLTEKLSRLLNETSEISSDVTFLNLNVLGNVTFDTAFMNRRLLNLGDLLLKTEENVEITGTKTFLGNVGMLSNVTITSGLVNGHFLDEFVTRDTDQEFPNLTKISSNVTFGNVTFGAVEKLEAFLNEQKYLTDCLDKIIVFKSPIIVDELSFDKLNNDISYEHFNQKLNETFQNVTFENLIAETLLAEEIVPKTVNNVDFSNFTKDLPHSNIIDEYRVDHLETDRLNVSFINGMSLDEINELIDREKSILESILNGNITLESLQVRGKIETKLINGELFADLYEDQIDTVIFKEDVSIKNLTVLGLMNGFNFSKRVSDTVLKTDKNIVINGHKIFNNISCQQLEIRFLNGRPVENILNPSRRQVLSGPVVVNGSVTILKEFNATGNIGNVSFQGLMDRFKPLENNTFELHGSIRFPNNVTIENLYLNGSIQGRNMDEFLNAVVLKKEDDLTISGTKVFEGSITFKDAFVVRERLNDIDLKKFDEKAVFIDKPFSVESKIVFKDDIKVEKDLAVKTSLEAKSIMGIDIEEMKLNVLHLDRPTYIDETITFTDVNFESDIRVEKFNDLDMNLLIPLNKEQAMPVKVLKCLNITVDKLTILETVNNQDLTEIQENTFMTIGSQNITGNFNFPGHVHIRRDFNPRLINGIDPTRFIPLNSKSSISGNFVFESPMYFNQSLRVLGYLNGINPTRWEAVAVTANNSLQQIISGRWTVFGNVYFERGASGSDIVNGINVTEISNTLAKRHLEMDAVLMEKNANLNSICDDLSHLKHFAEKQIYQFAAFDYLQIIELDSGIVSVHYFELDDLDYFMLSYNTCQMHTYLFTGTKFELVANVPDFGVVERWTTFKHDQILYFLTSGASSCGRGPVNLWKLKNDEFQHVLDLDRSIDSRKINKDIFLTLIGLKGQMRSSARMDEELEKSLSSLEGEDDVKIVLEDDQMLLTSRSNVYEYNTDRSNGTSLGKYTRSPEILHFKAGLLEKEMFLYYDEEFSKDRIFICNRNAKRKQILQTLKVHRPTSFTILNFEGSIETLLVFVENKKKLRIYEYKGIQGFVYRDSIRMNVDKLFAFKFRKYTNFAKRHLLALIHENRLTILEAKMYGEKVDMAALTC
ncbi:hypothetical protein WH47_12162 [Habropoda laboriosa]|uniref:Uncharacterized protein n=1 Tax=Habropoda laboriosa TaxID=597456 RepID=A0A0L7RAB5_9HYME|nr:PREDICTED: uncharacterized protein LOC108580229 [Habropoda laboriosa]KOC67832.1 hypothetical protein WH47_12162 [Habropoda laboriosa]